MLKKEVKQVKRVDYVRICPICSKELNYRVECDVLGKVIYNGTSFITAWDSGLDQTMPFRITSSHVCSNCSYVKEVLDKSYVNK